MVFHRKKQNFWFNNKFQLGIREDRFWFGIPDKRLHPKLAGVDSELFKVDSSQANFSLESTHQDSIPKFVGATSRVKVIMMGCVFIQTNGLTL